MKTLKNCVLHIRDDGSAYIDVLPEKSCGGCKGCGMCNIFDDAVYQLPVENTAGHKDNEMITAEINLPSQTLSALLIFGQLLLITLAGGAVGNYFFGDAGLFGGGILGITLGFTLIYVLQKSVLNIKATILDVRNSAQKGDSSCCHDKKDSA